MLNEKNGTRVYFVNYKEVDRNEFIFLFVRAAYQYSKNYTKRPVDIMGLLEATLKNDVENVSQNINKDNFCSYLILDALPTTLYAKVVELDAGFDSEKEEIANIGLGTILKVERVSMGQSYTYIYTDRGCLNSVFLEFFDDLECTKPHDIYNDPMYNPYI